MKFFGILTLFLIMTMQASAEDTTGYSQISDLKAFATYISIYLESGETHTCKSDGSASQIFSGDVNNSLYSSFLLTAFTAGIEVNLKYTCSGNTASVTGVRLKR